MERWKAAIIDDGISGERFPGVENWTVDGAGNIVPGPLPRGRRMSHGETCFSLLSRYAPRAVSAADWLSVQVLERETERGNVARLCRALEFCARKNVRLIHMSIGTSAFWDFEPLEQAVRALLARGIHIVAAADNRGGVTLPACLPGVLGVRLDLSLTGGAYRYRGERLDRIEFGASGRHSPPEGQAPIPPCNSFAAPVVTAAALTLLQRQPVLTAGELKAALIHGARPVGTPEELPLPEPGHDALLLRMDGYSREALLERMDQLRRAFLREGYYCGAAAALEAPLPDWLLPLKTPEDLWQIHRFYQHDVLLAAAEQSLLGSAEPGAVLWYREPPESGIPAFPDAPAEKMIKEILKEFG